MPGPVLPKHQAQAPSAAASAQAPAGPDAEKTDGQHAESGPGCPWRSSWGQWLTLSWSQQWSNWSRYPYICGHTASYPSNTHSGEHACTSTATGGWHGGNGSSRPATTGSAARRCHAPPTPSPSVSASGWRRWRGDDELSSAADGASAPAAASQCPATPAAAAHWWFASVQPQTPWSLSSPPVTGKTWTRSSHPTAAATTQSRSGIHACTRPTARPPFGCCRDGPKNSALSRDPETDGPGPSPDPWLGTGGHDTPTSSPPKHPGPDGHAPHWGPGHAPPDSGSCRKDYVRPTAAGNASGDAARWPSGAVAASSSAAAPASSAGRQWTTPANKPAVGSWGTSHESSTTARHDGSHGTTAAARSCSATAANESAATSARKPWDDAGNGCVRRGSWGTYSNNGCSWIRKPTPGSTTRPSANSAFSKLTTSTTASPQHPSFQPNPYGCFYQTKSSQISRGSGWSWRTRRASARGPWRCKVPRGCWRATGCRRAWG